MRIVFRVDASIQIANGHVMRCLALADELNRNEAECVFICREHNGNLLAYIRNKGYLTIALPKEKPSLASNNHDVSQEYLTWLGVSVEKDALQTITAIQSLDSSKGVNWLIVDHYALGRDWEVRLRPYCKKIMSIDDLANREHDCDLLLDQTLGRDEKDYQVLVPENCSILTGPYYALLRPEFSEWREYSLNRRLYPKLKHLLVSLGGVDKDNHTGKVLEALVNSDLPRDCKITVVIGENSPYIDTIKEQIQLLQWPVELKFNVANMAELMANSDFCIGAAGSSAWERCCLGLPSITLVLADNQQKIANELREKNMICIEYNAHVFLTEFNYLIKSSLFGKNYIAGDISNICDGKGVSLVKNFILAGPLIRKMRQHDIESVFQWRNDSSVRLFMFNQTKIGFEEHLKWINENFNNEFQYLLIFENYGIPQAFIRFSVEQDVADWGFYKRPGSPKGIGKQLGFFAIDYAFKKIGLKKIKAQVINYNDSSLFLHRRIGFHECEVLKNVFFDGENHHSITNFEICNKQIG